MFSVCGLKPWPSYNNGDCLMVGKPTTLGQSSHFKAWTSSVLPSATTSKVPPVGEAQGEKPGQEGDEMTLQV